MKASKACVDLIKKWEGYQKRLPNGDCQAYPDVGSKDGLPVTIGFGTTAYHKDGLAKYNRREVMITDVLTFEQAESELMHEIEYCSKRVEQLNPNLKQNQHDACVSFFYNCGFANSQSERLKAGDLKAFADNLPLYKKGGDGRVLNGLVQRRLEELDMFLRTTTMQLGSKGTAVQKLHDNLEALDFLGKGSHGDYFTEATERAVIWFQKTHQLKPDGIVGPKTQAAIEAALEVMKRVPPKPADFCEVRKALPGEFSVKSGWHGLVPLILEIGNKGHKIQVASGAPQAQNFRLPNDPKSYPGNMEPLPQGVYEIGEIDWAGKKDDYKASHGAGLGPVWVPLTATFKQRRGAFGGHLDANISKARGSAGCVVFHNVEDLKKFVNLLRLFKPQKLNVDWGL